MRIYIGILPDNEKEECLLEYHRRNGENEKGEPNMEHLQNIPIGVSHISQVLEIQEGDCIFFKGLKS